MKYAIFHIIIFSFFFQKIQAQSTITGVIYDDLGESLPGALILSEAGNSHALSNEYGYFVITLINDDQCFMVSYAGFEKAKFCMEGATDTTIDIFLKSKELSEVVIAAKRQLRETTVGLTRLPLKIVEKIPNLAGEPDLIKAFSFTPGVSNGSEGSSGLYVRGGTPDQNLILLDGATVYNPNHLFGFYLFSTLM